MLFGLDTILWFLIAASVQCYFLFGLVRTVTSEREGGEGVGRVFLFLSVSEAVNNTVSPAI